jgi:enterochelin esterase-like enzyme
MREHYWLQPRLLAALAVSFATLGLALFAAITATAAGRSDSHAAASGRDSAHGLGPKVAYTGQAPTGYQVTFRYYDPGAASVLIKGAWSFASEASEATNAPNLPPSATSTPAGAAVIPPGGPILPAQWKFGDFPLTSPNTPSDDWPVAAMTKRAGGIWEYTTPLPAGWFDYQFFPNCTSATTNGCSSTTDPANPPQLTACSACDQSSTSPYSEIYVPADRRFDPVDLSWQSDDLPAGARGNVVDVSIPDSQTSSGTANLAVYTPPGYDAHRSVPYPLFVLTHGGGENETTWTDRGMVEQITDHVLAAHEMQPAVIVMPNGSGNFQTDVTDQIIPWVQRHYNVSGNAAARAFAGTSAFGSQANNFLFNDTAEFGYYGLWSPAAGAPPLEGVGAGYPAGPPTAPAYMNPELKNVLGIHLAIGQYDLGGNAPQATAQTERIGLNNAGVSFRWFSVDGGHTWTFWRLALQDFLTHSGFRTTATTATLVASGSTDTVSATVSALTTEPATPTGTVQVFVTSGAIGDCTAGGSCYPTPVGAPVRLRNGIATVRLAKSEVTAGASVTVQYGGDNYYNSSVSTPISAS